MSELLLELFAAVCAEDDDAAKEIMEKIDFEYEMLCRIVGSLKRENEELERKLKIMKRLYTESIESEVKK